MNGHWPEEHKLLHKAQNGDKEAFGDIYERYALKVYRFLFAHLGNTMDAEDLTEETFLRAWRSLGEYDQRGVPFLAFLLRIARNALVDHYRSKSIIESDLISLENMLRDPQPEPGEQAQSNFEQRELRTLLGLLRVDQRDVLIARFLLGYSPEEIAQIMGKSAGAVRVLQHRALASLKKLMEDRPVSYVFLDDHHEAYSLLGAGSIRSREQVMGDRQT